jgi:3-hydroxyacyl-[acyl-carrier-protein] dehydratase
MIAEPLTAFDNIISIAEARVETQKYLGGNEMVFVGHYPHFPIYPGVFVLETILQTIGCWAKEHGDELVFSGVRSLRLFSPATPGDILTCVATVRERGAGDIVFDAKCTGEQITFAKAVVCFTYAGASDAKALAGVK